jgi:hypothetical protein
MRTFYFEIELRKDMNWNNVILTLTGNIIEFPPKILSIIDHTLFLNIEVGLWCLTPLSTIFQLYPGGQFY